MNRREIFVESDTDNDNCLSLNEVVAAFQKLQSKITSYPAVRPNLSPLPSLFFSLSPVARAPLAAMPPPADIHLPWSPCLPRPTFISLGRHATPGRHSTPFGR